jgi:hypothetical protein
MSQCFILRPFRAYVIWLRYQGLRSASLRSTPGYYIVAPSALRVRQLYRGRRRSQLHYLCFNLPGLTTSCPTFFRTFSES